MPVTDLIELWTTDLRRYGRYIPSEAAEEIAQGIRCLNEVADRQEACAEMHKRFPKFLWCRLVWPYARLRIGGNREHWCQECEGPEDSRTQACFKAGPLTLEERKRLYEDARRRMDAKRTRKDVH